MHCCHWRAKVSSTHLMGLPLHEHAFDHSVVGHFDEPAAAILTASSGEITLISPSPACSASGFCAHTQDERELGGAW